MKHIKKATSLFLILIMVCTVIQFPANAASDEDVQALVINEMELTTEQLNDGVTVVLTRNEDGTFEQTSYDDVKQIPMLASTADGILEWAIFHLGLKNSTHDLYFTLSADEPVKVVWGEAYVKSTNLLASTTYYSNSFYEEVYSSSSSRTIKSGIDTKDATKVIVGFKNAALKTIAGETGSFSNNSKTVTL